MSKQKSKTVQPDVSSFDYQNLNGDQWNEYQKVVKSLLANEKYDFELWLASSVIKKKFNEDTGKILDVMAGITLNGSKPVMITRITARQAAEINTQVSHIQTSEYRNTSKYLLLATAQHIEAVRKESEVEHA